MSDPTTPAASDANVRSVIVLGMHRSGTSMIAGLIERLGIFGGDPSEKIAADASNEAGYSELRAVRDLDEELLRDSGCTLYAPPIDLDHEFRSEGEDAKRARAESIARDLAGRGGGQFLLKDPRLCLTLPWWRPWLGRVACVLCVRHPAAIAESLARRDGFDRRRSVLLWEIYLRQALHRCAGLPLLPVGMDETLREPVREVARMRAFLAGQGFRLGPDDDARVAEGCRPALRHSESRSDELLDARQRRLLALASRGERDESWLRETEPECRGHRIALAQLGFQGLLAENRRLQESAAWARDRADGLEWWKGQAASARDAAQESRIAAEEARREADAQRRAAESLRTECSALQPRVEDAERRVRSIERWLERAPWRWLFRDRLRRLREPPRSGT